MYMTEQQAKVLATFDPDYCARKMKGRWYVWSDVSQHIVEFAQQDIDRAALRAKADE